MHISQHAFLIMIFRLLLSHWRSQSEDTSQPYNIVLHAKDMLTNLEAQNRLEELAHAKLDPPCKIVVDGTVSRAQTHC
jgi:hypothetical protein